MKSILKTRLKHLKYNWLHVLFWLVFPLLFTFAINYLVLAIESDTKIPIAVIEEEDTELSKNLVEAIETTDYLRVVDLEKKEALNQLKKNELDAVFVIKSGYERQIERGGRNRLIEAYESDLSLAFLPITETITSYIQQDAGRSKAFYEFMNLNERYHQKTTVDLNEFINLSKEKAEKENLLETSLLYNDSEATEKQESLVKPESVWLISYLISVLMLFDWVIKESTHPVVNRFPFLKRSYKRYLLSNWVIYSLVIFIMSLISIIILQLNFSIIALLAFQLSINGLVFLIATRFKQTLSYYAFTVGAVLLVTVISGLFIPLNQFILNSVIFDLLNPFTLILEDRIYYIGIIITALLLFIWSIRKGQNNA